MHIAYSSRNFVPSTEPSTNQSQNKRRRGGEKRKGVEEAEEISKKSVPEISSIFKKKRKFEKMKSGKKTDLKNTQATSGYMSLLQAFGLTRIGHGIF
jgi:hypothetical protein